MAAEISMPQQSDTMTEGTVVKWLKKEGDAVRSGEIIAEIETDKATMEMEAFDAGTLAAVLVPEGKKVPVGTVLAVVAKAGEKPDEVKRKYASGAKSPAESSAQPPAPAQPQGGSASPRPPAPAAPKPATGMPVVQKPAAPAAPVRVPPGKRYDWDLIVIGGGPAGYAAAIRAGQLKKRVLCIEKENLGGTCLNWGCIPTKALLEDGAFVRKLRDQAGEHGVSYDNLKIDFSKLIGRSRKVADGLKKGIGFLFSKNGVKHELATGQLLGPHRVRYTGKDGSKEASAEHVIIAVGAKSTPLPFAPFDGKRIVGSREAMTLPSQPRRMAIIGAGAIGCEFADFYSAVGTEVTLIEMLPSLLPIEDEEVSLLLKRVFEKRGIKVLLNTKTEKVETGARSVKLTLSGETQTVLEVDVVLVAIGVSANIEGVAAPEAKLELANKRIKTDHEYRTNLENVWAVGDCVSIHWPEQMAMGGYRHPDLAHVAHHEAVNVVEHLCGVSNHTLDYKFIPGCTYTHPQVASMGYTERKAREAGKQIKVGKFPFSASGRALAAGEPTGFVKLIFDAKYGELLGVHMIGENVTDMLGELVVARNLEATEEEILQAIHPHPTYSEAIMEAAGASDGKAIHI